MGGAAAHDGSAAVVGARGAGAVGADAAGRAGREHGERRGECSVAAASCCREVEGAGRPSTVLGPHFSELHLSELHLSSSGSYREAVGAGTGGGRDEEGWLVVVGFPSRTHTLT